MKFSFNILFGLALLLSQALVAFASPIDVAKNSLRKRSFPPFHARYSPVYFLKPKNWSNKLYAYIYTKNESLNLETGISQWPGKRMDNGSSYFDTETKYNYYNVRIPYGYYNNTFIIFSDGEHQAPGVLKEGFNLIVNGVYDETGIVGTLDNKNFNYDEPKLAYGNFASIFYRPKNKENSYGSIKLEVYAHYKIGNGEWNSIPGDKMNGEPYSGYYFMDIDLGDSDEFTICFTNGKGKWDNNNGENFKFKKFQTYIIDRIDNEDAPYL